ncbi:MAG: OmpW family outer membrane protein [Rubrivivax sp.]
MQNYNNKPWITLAVAAAALLPALQARAQDKGDWIVRARALYLDSANKDSTGLKLTVNNKTFPEFDVSYFLTPNLALELVLTYPQKHTIRANGSDIGSLKHLPPTLSVQYHFSGLPVRPYVGAGLNYTRFSDVEFSPAVAAALQPTVKKNSFGLALGAGVDVPLGGGWLFNADLKKLQIATAVSSFGTEVGKFKVDPWLYSVGIGKRF